MAKAEIKRTVGRKEIVPLVMALGNKILNTIGFVEKIDDSVEWDKNQWAVSPGRLMKWLVLSTFNDVRIPLTRIEDRMASMDMRYFLGEDLLQVDINSFNVGRALERLGESDSDSIYETLSLSMMQMNQIQIERLHSDTTTISFYGEYDCDLDKMGLTEEEKAEILKLERGHNKDGKPDCKQVVVGQIVNENGIPVISRTQDGATSDVEWNKKAIEYLRQVQEKGFSTGIYVADCKLVNKGLITNMMEGSNPVRFVSRCPASFEEKLESRIIEKAYDDGNWEYYGQLSEGEKSAKYEGISYIETVCSHPMRLLVVKSSNLIEKAEKNIEKQEEKLMPLIRKLEKKTFACHEDALVECTNFFNERKLFNATTKIECTIEEKYPRGRRKKGTTPVIKEKYKIIVEKLERNQEACRIFTQNESSFVIISNVLDNMSDRDLLATYKGQQIVENSFRLLKHPQLASVIYLKKPVRIKALTMILSIALLIRAIIQYKLREGLKKFKVEHPEGKLMVGWNGRELKAPTYRLLYEHSIECYFERESMGKYSFSWPYCESEERVGTLLWLMGLNVLDLIE